MDDLPKGAYPILLDFAPQFMGQFDHPACDVLLFSIAQ